MTTRQSIKLQNIKYIYYPKLTALTTTKYTANRRILTFEISIRSAVLYSSISFTIPSSVRKPHNIFGMFAK